MLSLIFYCSTEIFHLRFYFMFIFSHYIHNIFTILYLLTLALISAVRKDQIAPSHSSDNLTTTGGVTTNVVNNSSGGVGTTVQSVTSGGSGSGGDGRLVMCIMYLCCVSCVVVMFHVYFVCL